MREQEISENAAVSEGFEPPPSPNTLLDDQTLLRPCEYTLLLPKFHLNKSTARMTKPLIMCKMLCRKVGLYLRQPVYVQISTHLT